MATLRNISENIAFMLDEQFNETLRQSVIDSILDYRAKFIRQDLERNPMSYTDYLQSFCIELIEVPMDECPLLAVRGFVLRSKDKLPKPIRLKGNGRTSFKYIGSTNGKQPFSFATGVEMDYVTYLDFQDNTIYYTMMNGYLYVLNNLMFCKIMLQYVIADPRQVDDCDNLDVLPDDIEFPLPTDMLADIKRSILGQYRQPIEDGEEVTTEKDD